MSRVLALVVPLFSGCTSDPVVTYRIGAPLDIAAFRREFGDDSLHFVRFDREQYEYRRCDVSHRGVGYAIDVSPGGRIVGLTAKVPCEGRNAPSEAKAMRSRLDAVYPNGLDRDTGAEVEIWTKYEPGSRRLVVTCFEPMHARLVRAYRERTRKPER